MPRRFLLALLVVLAGCVPPTARPGNDTGTFAVVSDLHLDPFAADGRTMLSAIGHDTTPALLASGLATVARAAASADFMLVPGDLLTHDFNVKAKGHGPDAAARTAIEVADALAATLPGKPVFVAFGNEDSACGDYRVEPHGPFLAATRDTVRRLAGADRLDADFDATWAGFGSYAARHPTVPNGRILVLNDVLWSRLYQDSCSPTGGRDGPAAGDALLAWLRAQLAQQRAAGGTVWMVHHIPWGIDAFAALHAPGATCTARSVPMLREPYASALLALVAEYRDTIRASFSGHTHFDDYRLLFDPRGAVVGLDKVTPAISPIFGQNPGFQVFTYDRATAAPTDIETWHLRNPGAPAAQADWRREYRFSEAYGRPYGKESVAALWRSMLQGGPARDTYRRVYRLGNGEIPADQMTAQLCAVGHVDVAGFAACWCGKEQKAP